MKRPGFMGSGQSDSPGMPVRQEATMGKARISKSGSGPLDYTVEVDGHDVTSAVRGIRWECEVGGVPRAELELAVAEAEMVEAEVEWFGLGSVPTEALRDELERRKGALGHT